ncbi:unnamed protein product [Victoria cruziana]
MPARRIAFLILTTLLIITCARVDEEKHDEAAPTTVSTLCLSNQSSALLRFKHSINRSLQPGNLSSWGDINGSSDCCNWEGVTCDNITGFVIALRIPYIAQGFVDQIDPSLFELQHLVHLDLSGNPFNDSIPKGLVELTHLTHLDLSHCLLFGQVPVEMVQLTQLVYLNLSENADLQLQHPNFTTLVGGLVRLQHLNLDRVRISMSGGDVSRTLLSSPSLQKKLQTLSLRQCNISGPLFFHLQSLSYLDLSENYLTGSIPSSFSNLSSLTQLDLSSNQLTGSIPSSFSNLSFLTRLDLSSNQLTGSIPSSFSTPSSLTYLFLDNNHLTGSIPSSFSNLSSLLVLFLGNNQLTGSISSSVFTLPSLDVLVLSYNRLHGLLPECLNRSSSLQYIFLGNNLLSGDISSFKYGFSYLSALDLSNNNIEGKIPSYLWSMERLEFLILHDNKLDGFEGPVNVTRAVGTPLSYLAAYNNRIGGTIPAFLCNSTDEGTVVDISNNALTGRIPPSLSNCTRLLALQVGNNKLEGDFPAWLGQLNNLKVLVLRSNDFHGPIPSHQAFSAMKILDISNNSFSGNLPLELFGGFKAMMRDSSDELNLFSNAYFSFAFPNLHFGLHGELEETIKGKVRPITNSTRAMNIIDMSNNNFTGKIPQEIGMLKYLHGLNISYNHLEGPIPQTLDDLLQLEWLDLSHNKLSGDIPQGLEALTFLSVLNLSYNDLQGMIPQGNQFNTFGPSSFEGNPKLCGQQIEKACSPPVSADHGRRGATGVVEEEKTGGWKYGSVGVGFAAGLLTIVLPIVFVESIADWYWFRTGRLMAFLSAGKFSF